MTSRLAQKHKKVKSKKSYYLPIFLIMACLLLYAPNALTGENQTKGNIIGFVFGEDGTSPMEGATVKFLNVSSDAVFESSQTDQNGLFTVKGIDSGIYIFGVLSSEGDFILDDLIGVKIAENETAKISISLAPFEKMSSADQKIYSSKNVTPVPDRESSPLQIGVAEPMQEDIVLETDNAVLEYRGIAKVNAASSGIAFEILTSDPSEMVEVQCVSPSTPGNTTCLSIRNWLVVGC